MITTMSPHAEQPPQQRLKSLVQQIVHDKKGVSKEQRITACDELQKFLLSLDTAANLECSWRDMCAELTSLLGTRVNPDTKRAVAECVGALGFLLAPHYDQFVKFITDAVKRSSDKYSEEKTMILRALAASLNFIGVCAVQSRVAPPHIEEVMTAVKKQLDTNDSPTVLIPLLDICLAVAQYFPAVFKKSFDDVVDFTVGWYVEPDQPKSVLDKCSQMLTDLRPFWFDALPTAVTLMKQFVDDATAYLEELGTEKEAKVEEALRKTAAILRALVTVLNVVNIPQAHPTVVPFVEKLFGQLACQSAHLKRIAAPEVGDVFASMVDVLWCSLQVVPKAECLSVAIKSVRIMIAHPAVGYGTVLKLIEFYEKVFDNISHEMTASVVEMVIGPEGAVHGLIYGSKEVLRAVINLYGKLLTPKALPTLQAAYHCVRTELSEVLIELECNSTSGSNCRKDAERRVLVIMNALGTLGSVKNSLIAMMGLSPSLFSMLMCETPITEKWFVVKYPGCHYALLYVVKMHSEKHDNFIASSGWLNERSRLPMLSEYPTANHFAKILHTLAKLLLIDDEMWCDTRNLVVDWVHGIAFGMSADVLQDVLDRGEMLEMRHALLESFLRHSLPRKVTSEAAQKSGAPTAVGADSSRASGARVRYFTLLRRLAVFNLVLDGDSRMVADFVTRVFERSRNCEQVKAIGFWQAIPPAVFVSFPEETAVDLRRVRSMWKGPPVDVVPFPFQWLLRMQQN